MKPLDSQRRVVPVAGAALTLATAIATVTTIAAKPGPHVPGDPVQTAGRLECPTDSLGITLYDEKNQPKGVISQIPLSGPITNIAGFHDCQRFVHGKAYDSVYAIFAAFQLDSLPPRLRAQQPESDRGAQAPLPALPAATIYSYGGTYARLGIEPGFNCLYLFNPPHWRAKMAPRGRADPNCAAVHDAVQAPGKELRVRVSRFGSRFGPLDYPPVARWDWDPRHRSQYIGIACGAAWCEIGDSAFVSSGPYRGPPVRWDFTATGALPRAQVRRVVQVKGWYDAQPLAVGATPTPTAVRGTVIPHPGLDRFTTAQQFDNRWIQVAAAVLDRRSLPYEKKYNFTPGPNMIYLCHGVAGPGGCTGVPPATPACSPDATGRLWWAKIVAGTSRSRVRYRCVTYRDHSGLNVAPIPAVARWRWTAKDETIWVRCTQGCCQVEQ